MAGTILVSGLAIPEHSYALAMIALIVFSAIGAVVALGIPKLRQAATAAAPTPSR